MGLSRPISVEAFMAMKKRYYDAVKRGTMTKQQVETELSKYIINKNVFCIVHIYNFIKITMFYYTNISHIIIWYMKIHN